MMDPKPFNIHNPADVDRWFTEMRGYLRACDFVNQGTDRSGRKYALECFNSLQEMLVSDRVFRGCPFCGGTADLAETAVTPGKDVTFAYLCRSCGRHVIEVHDYSSSESEDRTVEEVSGP
ncbi:MAG: hypothetical protein WC343_02020 [Bacilli bacterium]|jgi:hypothetical protein